MASTINATTSGIVNIGDSVATLALQTGGTTAVAIDTAQIVTLSKSLALLGSTSGSVALAAPAVAGTQSYTLPTAVPAASGYALTSTTAGVMSWAAAGGSPGGSTTQVQYNNAGAFGGISGFTTDGTRVTASTTIGVGGATPSISGSGITFPATQSASTDANTLDDYEEGTWTPSFTGTTTAGSGSYSFQAGSYTKVGRLVTIYGGMQFTGGTGTGNLQISGLPFSSNNFGSITIVISDNLAFTVGSLITGYSSGTNIQLQQIPAGGAGSTAAVPYDANISQFIFFGSYFTS
jgi:hypothetical protein